jgi:hypothetical protein
MDCPLLVWMLTLSREVKGTVRALSPSRARLWPVEVTHPWQEYEECYKLVKDCIPGAPEIKHAPDSPDSLREAARSPCGGRTRGSHPYRIQARSSAR